MFADFLQNRCFKKIRNIHRRTPVFVSVSNKVVGLKGCNFIKKSLQNTGEFYCEYCEIFKNGFFYRTPLMAASRVILIDDSLCLFTLEKK